MLSKMAAKPHSTIMLTVTLLLMCTGFATSATRCPNCGTTQVPYPLSTGPNCGDQSYKVRCQMGTGSLFFDTLNNTYPITSISQTTQRFVIQPSNFLNNNNTCVTADVSSQGLLLDPTLPFNITSGNTIMYLNCSESLLRSPLNCTSTSLCHSYINNSAEASSCSRAPICCTFRTGGSSTQYAIRVRDGGCQAYRSFPNLDYSLPVSRWPAPGVEIQWVSPPEPLCSNQTDCDASSTCLLSSSGGVRRCLCNTGLHWDAIDGVCALDDTCDNRGDCSDSNRTALIAGS
nr:wall-associated receptor kinase-like 20 [Tanacetum cinerariifolium]